MTLGFKQFIFLTHFVGGRKHKLMRNLGNILFFIFIFVCGVYLFSEFTRRFEYYDEASLAAGARYDAIVVLTGGSGRVDAGLELLRDGHGNILVISGVARDATLDTIFVSGLGELESYSIVLDKRSKSTYENAMELRRIIHKNEFESILLVTSTYHMQRAAYILYNVLPWHVEIGTYSVPSPNFNPRAWWQGRGPVIILSEFFKYYYYYLKFSIVFSIV